MLWVQYSGQGLPRLHKLECMSAEVRDLYNQRYPLDHVDMDGEIGRDADGMLWSKWGTDVERTSMAKLQPQSQRVEVSQHPAGVKLGSLVEQPMGNEAASAPSTASSRVWGAVSVWIRSICGA